jgi:hypothetical protein
LPGLAALAMALLASENNAASLGAESNSFDCEDGRSSEQQSVGKSVMSKRQKWIFRSCGFCAAALIGFVALGPVGVGSQVTNSGQGNMARAFAPSRPLPIFSTRTMGMSPSTRSGSPVAALPKKEPTPLSAVVFGVENAWKGVFGSGNMQSERDGRTSTENAIAQRQKGAVARKVVKKVVAKKVVAKKPVKKVVAKKPVKKIVAKKGTKGKAEEKKGGFFR